MGENWFFVSYLTPKFYLLEMSQKKKILISGGLALKITKL